MNLNLLVYYTTVRVLRRFIVVYKRTLFKKNGKNFVFDPFSRFTYQNIDVGESVYIGPGAHFSATDSYIKIGNKVMFGPNVTIMTGDHNASQLGRFMIDVKEKLPDNDKPVIIEDDVWIGAGVIILKGVKIARGSIVAAGSLVNKNVPPYGIVAGVPARVIRYRWSISEIIEHEKSLYDTQSRLSRQQLERTNYPTSTN